MSIVLDSVTKIYPNPYTNRALTALRSIDLNIPQGCYASIIGPSGAGKSTLLKIIAGLEKPTSGKVRVLDKDIDIMASKEVSSFRFNNIGILNQIPSLNLFSNLSVLENITIPQLMKGKPRQQAKRYSSELLKLFDLTHLTDRSIENLSAGEAMRVALASAIAKEPKILLCDEPTGQLDYNNTIQLVNILKDLSKTREMTVVVVSHDPIYFTVVEHSYLIYGGRLGAVYLLDEMETTEIRPISNTSTKKIRFKSYVDKYSYVYLPNEVKEFLSIKDQLVYTLDLENKRVFIESPNYSSKVSDNKQNYDNSLSSCAKQDSPQLKQLQSDYQYAIICEIVRKKYPNTKNNLFDQLNFKVKKGEMVFILGPSGIGKTTLFNLIAGLDLDFKGTIKVLGYRVTKNNARLLSYLRRRNLFYLSQYVNLYPKSSLIENIKIFLSRAKLSIDQKELISLLKFLDLFEIRHNRIENYSEGEKRRAATLLSILLKPQLLLADEPTANLDAESKKRVLSLFYQYHLNTSNTIVIITHDIFSLLPNTRLIELKNGTVVQNKMISVDSLNKLKNEYLSKKSIFL